MPYTILVHVMNEDPVIGEVEELPDPSSQFLLLRGPRMRDGGEVRYFMPETNQAIYPWHRIHSVEVMPTEGEEEIVTYIRE